MPTYSNSRLSKFKECPQAYKFKYIYRVDVEKVRNVYGFLGSRVHETLEVLHEDLKNGKRNSLDELLEIYEDLWEEKWSEDIQVPEDRYSPENFKKVGKECITNYYEKHEPFDRTRTIDTELMIYPEVRAREREYTFQGFIDRLAVTPEGKFEVHDYKTSKNLPSKKRLEDKRQLPLYQMGVRQDHPDAENVELVWHFLRFGKDIRVSHSRDEIDEIQRELVGIIEEIENAREKEDFPTKRGEGAKCDWCDYKRYCPEWKHRYETREMPENEFLNEDGVELVDELTEVNRRIEQLQEEKSKLEEKRDKLEKAIIDHAKREGLQSVYGSEKRASIEDEEKIKFPKSAEEGREKLEELVQEFERWEDLSTSYLNISTLRKAYEDRGLPEDLLTELEDFKKIVETEEVELEEIED